MRKKHDRRYPELDLIFPDSPDLVVGTSCGGMTYSPISFRTSSFEQDNAKNYLGDPSCIYKARSKYLLCAVNPTGTCSDCQHYRHRSDEEVGGQKHGELLKYLASLPQGKQEEILALALHAAILRKIRL
jgi:hypothetical protein